MVKLKRILSMLLVIVFVAGITPAFPQARYGLRKSAAVQTSTALVLPAGTWVYGLEIFADAANSFMGIYNAATLPASDNATVMDEIGEATQYDTATKMYTKPIYFPAGVSVIMSTGVGFIIYGPEPD